MTECNFRNFEALFLSFVFSYFLAHSHAINMFNKVYNCLIVVKLPSLSLLSLIHTFKISVFVLNSLWWWPIALCSIGMSRYYLSTQWLPECLHLFWIFIQLLPITEYLSPNICVLAISLIMICPFYYFPPFHIYTVTLKLPNYRMFSTFHKLPRHNSQSYLFEHLSLLYSLPVLHTTQFK